MHPPTVYFPLLVDEALLIEPTETETKETLDRFAEIVAEILREAAEDPEIARGAPYTTPVRRLDEAARGAPSPVLRQPLCRPMRFVIFGAGAIGGVVGARLHQSRPRGGADRPRRAPGGDPPRRADAEDARWQRAVLRILAAVQDPAELGLGAATTSCCWPPRARTRRARWPLLRAGRAERGADRLPAERGRATSAPALRLFGDVYGAVVMVPAAHLRARGGRGLRREARPGSSTSAATRRGSDERCEAISQALAASSFSSRVPVPTSCGCKYAKLLLNLGNAVERAVRGRRRRRRRADRAGRATEGRAALTAAGIEHRGRRGHRRLTARWERLGVQPIDGRQRAGSSSWQSLARGTGTIETDYLNGEIVLLGRLHGVPDAAQRGALPALAATRRAERARPGRAVESTSCWAVAA